MEDISSRKQSAGPGGKPQLPCDGCGKFYSSKQTLKIHKSISCSQKKLKAKQNTEVKPKISLPASTSISIEKDSAKQQQGRPRRSKTSLEFKEREEFVFNEDDTAYWAEFVTGTQC